MTTVAAELPLLGRWITGRIRMTLRHPRALVFTLAFPLILVVLFSALNGNAEIDAYGTKVRFAQFYTPAIAVFSLVTACYTTLILGLSTARDQGLLKRVRGTPLPMGIYLGSWVTGAAATGLGAVVLLFAVSIPAFGVEIHARTLPAAIVTLLLGAACLAALGVAIASVVKSADQAMPVAQLTFLPIIVNAFGGCFVPGATGSGFNGSDLGAIAIWTGAGLFVAVRRFRQNPP
jgi:ABC-2 type transport system permease protein